uniref:Uncharacterized protein n=1 Tax=Arundo donax TaxID=35708 RepID=A0A0A9C2H4_ARUDO
MLPKQAHASLVLIESKSR